MAKKRKGRVNPSAPQNLPIPETINPKNRVEKVGDFLKKGYNIAAVIFTMIGGYFLIDQIAKSCRPSDEYPVLDVLVYDKRLNPILFRDSVLKDSVYEQYHFFASVGTLTLDMAYNIKERFTLISSYRGVLVIAPNQILRQANESIIADTGIALRMYSGFLSDYRSPKSDSCYYFLKVDYENRDGESQKPLRKIWGFTMNDVKKPIREVDDATYKAMKSFLQKENLW